MKAIVTGHTRGLGAAIAENLLARGVAVLGISRSNNTTLARNFPAALEQVELDLSDSASLARWLESGRLRQFLAGSETVLLINNAGLLQPVGPIATHDVAAIARSVGVNVAAPLMLAAAVAAAPDAGEQRILHVSSGAGRSPYPGWSIYCATKAALDQHAQAAALDRTPGLRICSLAPGVIDTDMQAEIRATSPERFPLREKFDALKRSGSLSDPAACAQRLVAYLLSEKFGELALADLRDTGE
ncbi:SDR family oxidoreductase [Noviherbaspirillum cavernae]|uniref:SDR family oxidoreductase n=1 Tax=Noviherbaspirillum cavernae TaxID=2320862 RepID=A0A418X4H6_9BURK|nr:SDR family oxidoreductase [Noviherbaspirillum cavernae]RJG07378.1 SDR family oxidoreductase [Noviherbaspirillum cavernae]